jgi:cysteinyl-tRNA synthetase
MLKMYNSLSRRVEEFEPINPPLVRMYTCGPTVYQFAHIGNFRAYSTADILVRVLRRNSFDVKFVMNITDVGHLTNDDMGGGDTGEDKIEKTAKKEGRSVWEVAQFYTDAFLRDYKTLNLTPPDTLAKATDHIAEQIALISRLEKKGLSYITADGIYFDTTKFSGYGKMSSLDQVKEGARVEVNPEKHSPRDFALWKFSGKTGQRQMEWESPWGVGFPGWHIECSAMSMKYLGEQLDIHTGGVDHKEIHHPNEIAQSEGATGKQFVKYWVHTAFMMVAGQKMSKSLGNIYTLYDLEKEGYDPLALRYLYLQTHYRQEMNFTFSALDAAVQALKKLRIAIATWGLPDGRLPEFEDRFFETVNDDLNMSKALSIVWEMVKSASPSAGKAASLFRMDEILGLDLQKGSAMVATEKQIVPLKVKELLRERKALRGQRRFSNADQIRKKIEELGYEIEDTKKGTRVRKR